MNESRVQRIRVLADWYQDVLDATAWAEQGSEQGAGLPLASRAWNHPSYRQFERLRLRMRDERPPMYWHFAETWIRCTWGVRLVCPRCGSQATPAGHRLDASGHSNLRHKHGQSAVWFRPKSVRMVIGNVNPLVADGALEWMADRWHGEPMLPVEIRQPHAA